MSETKHKMKRYLWYVILVALMLAGAVTVGAQDELTGTVNNVTLNVRAAPDVESQRVGQLPGRTPVQVLGRNNAGDWLFVNAPDVGVRGWVAVGFVTLERPVRIIDEIPLTDERGNAADAPESGTAPESDTAPVVDEPPPERTDYPAIYLPQNVLANARNIYARGQQRGNNPFSLIKIGESNMAETVFLCTFEWDAYDLGEYTYLQGIVDGFSDTGSLCRFHFTAQRGFSTAGVLDATFATDDFCQPNETPLACEVRRSAPAYAIIYIGNADQGSVSESQYRSNLTRIVQQLSGWGVVPILSTYPTSEGFDRGGKPQAHNAIIREVAQAQRVPMIDARAALYEFEDRGTGPDGYHLSVRDSTETTFTGDEQIYGRTWLEFQTLNLLHDLHNAFNG